MDDSFILLHSFGVIAVTGIDNQSFLHQQLSNDIKSLKDGEACYATYNTPQGRVITNLIVTPQGEDTLFLILKKNLISKTLKRLSMYILRSKVILKDVSIDFSIIGKLTQARNLDPSSPPLRFPTNYEDNKIHIHLPLGNILSIYPTNKIPPNLELSEKKWTLFEIEKGIPWIDVNTSETTIAQMLNQEILGGIHFKKGCYPGQEIIARSQYRGKVKRKPVNVISKELLKIGEKILLGKEAVGIILMSCPFLEEYISLAIIKMEVTQEENLRTENNKAIKINKLFF